MADNFVMVIERPGPDTNTKYILVIYRPMPFGFAPVLFGIDEFTVANNDKGEPVRYEGYRSGEGLVISFPVSFDYMVLSRSGVRFVEEKELKKEMPEEDDEPQGPAARRYEYI